MNARQMYLGWVRTQFPRVYITALKQTFSPRGNLAGLGDDLISSVDSGNAQTVAPSADVTDAVNAAYDASQSSDTSNAFSALANAISSVGSTIVNTQAQENLLKINTQRASQGLPPLTANGIPVTGSMLSPTNATIAQMEAALSGGAGSWLLPVAVVGGLGLLWALSRRG